MGNVSFVNIEKAEFLSRKLIFKYVDIEHALKLLKTKNLWFANPTIWKDPFEKRFIEAKYSGMDFPWKDKVFCTCFTNVFNSEAFWKAYSNNGICAKISFYREGLLEILEQYANKNQGVKIFVGKAEYMKTHEITCPLGSIPFNPSIVPSMDDSFLARLLLLKRVAYQFEDEYRVLVVKNKKSKSPKGIDVPFRIDIDKLIERITLDPKLEPYTSSLLKESIKNYMKNGQHIKVFQSSLYKNNVKSMGFVI